MCAHKPINYRAPAYTVWDGERLLFDFNFQAMGISPKECFERAFEKELQPGKLMQVHMAEHYTLDKTGG